jgi:hypothetical protein
MPKIKKDLDLDFIKIKRRIDNNWNMIITTESTNNFQNNSKVSSFSFKDTHYYNLKDTGIEYLTNIIAESFAKNIEPYADIFTEKIVSDSFRGIRSFSESPFGIYAELERLAWEIYNENKPDENIDKEFTELCDLYYRETFTNNNYYLAPPFDLKRQCTAAISMSVSTNNINPKINFKKIDSYYNSYQKKIAEIIKEGLEVPPKMTGIEILSNIARIKRYFKIIKLSKTSFNKILEEKDTITNFENLVNILEKSINELFDQVCKIYYEDTEMN